MRPEPRRRMMVRDDVRDFEAYPVRCRRRAGAARPDRARPAARALRRSTVDRRPRPGPLRGRWRSKSAAGSGETFWDEYNRAYVASHRRARATTSTHAADRARRTRNACLWRWPIPESVAGARRARTTAGVPIGRGRNASGQIAEVLRARGVCQVGDGDRTRGAGHRRQPRRRRGQARARRSSTTRCPLRRHRRRDGSPTSATR